MHSVFELGSTRKNVLSVSAISANGPRSPWSSVCIVLAQVSKPLLALEPKRPIRWRIRGLVCTRLIKQGTGTTHCGAKMALSHMSMPKAGSSKRITHGLVASALSARSSVACSSRKIISCRENIANGPNGSTAMSGQHCRSGAAVVRRRMRGCRVSHSHHRHQSGRGRPPRRRSRRVLHLHHRHSLRATAGFSATPPSMVCPSPVRLSQ